MCSEEGSVAWQGEYVTRTSYDREDTTNEHEFQLFQLVNSEKCNIPIKISNI